MAHLVTDTKREEWIGYADDNYKEWMEEGYLIESKREGPEVYDNFEKIGYQSFITKATAEGFVKEDDKPKHWVAWTYSPPPFTYGFINWDFTGVPDYDNIIKAALELKDQTLFTKVRRYVSADIAFTKEEHEAMHSAKSADVPSEIPHSIIFHPVNIDPDDSNSQVVAMLAGGLAWDAALLDLLPHDARGIVVVIKNNCDQSYSFQIDGPDAKYLGEGDLHDTDYDNMEVAVVLTEYTNPDYKEVEGHCMYRMVSLRHMHTSCSFLLSESSPSIHCFLYYLTAHLPQ
jgi:hypothetical protein